jgi:Methyltransferase FkbM domain
MVATTTCCSQTTKNSNHHHQQHHKPTKAMPSSPSSTSSAVVMIFGTGMLFGFFISSITFFVWSTTTISGRFEEEACRMAFSGSSSGRLRIIHHHDIVTSSSSSSSSSSSTVSVAGTTAATTAATIPTTIPSGWKTINVFYGNASHLIHSTDVPSDYFFANRWFSQARQDEIVHKLLNSMRNGYFIDLASNDAVRLSNTYALETHFGWNGLCIEPNPIYWTGLSYRKCSVVGAVVGATKMEEVRFKFPKSKAPKGGIIGTKFDNKVDEWNEGQPRYTVPLEEIFDMFQVPSVIDYFNLDVEGAEEFVMRAFPFDKYQFNVLTIERPNDNVVELLLKNNYVRLKQIKAHEDELWVHHSVMDSVDKTALQINSHKYKYRDNIGQERIIPPPDIDENEQPTTTEMETPAGRD